MNEQGSVTQQRPKNIPCQYCGAPDTIENSHVVPDFMIRYLKANSVRRAFFHSWSRDHFRDYMITGPYLCQPCDNNVFGGWEGHFSQDVFSDSDMRGVEIAMRIQLGLAA